MVNKKNVRLWVDELRSGKYTQGVGYLHQNIGDKDYFCCLGVACKTAIDNGFYLVVEKRDDVAITTYDGSDTFLPRAVYDWLGVEFNSINFIADQTYSSVGGEIVYQQGDTFDPVDANDTLRLNFDKIADLIEEEYLKSDEVLS